MTIEADQQERLAQRFRFWDTDGDGRVEREDFEAEGRGILRNFGESEHSPKGRAVMSAYLGMWDYLAQLGGVDADGFTPECFSAVCMEHILEKGEAGFAAVVRPTIRAIVELCDTDGDGRVDREGFRLWTDAIGIDRATADEAFRRVDSRGNGLLTTEELTDAVRAYHAGELDAPLLGP